MTITGKFFTVNLWIASAPKSSYAIISDLTIDFEVKNAGIDVYEKTGELIPESLYESIEKNRIRINDMIIPISDSYKDIFYDKIGIKQKCRVGKGEFHP